jgi:hypothetical protein
VIYEVTLAEPIIEAFLVKRLCLLGPLRVEQLFLRSFKMYWPYFIHFHFVHEQNLSTPMNFEVTYF